MNFEEQLARLNPAQRRAVDTIDGPLLVIAGPGTGKTQLLSLRAANILRKRDVAAHNLLCLTYTETGAEAMSKRLVELIGRDAYGIEVATFHGFAQGLRSRYPAYFDSGASNTLISTLEQRRFVEHWLDGLTPASPLYSQRRNNIHGSTSDLIGFISTLKRSGLTPDEFRAIVRQTIESIDYLENETPLLDFANIAMTGGVARKTEIVNAFESSIARAISLAPRTLLERRDQTPGIYEPYLKWLSELVARTELINEDGKIIGFNEIRSQLFAGSAKEGRTFKDRAACLRALEVANLYERYEAFLDEGDYHDYDDMILDATKAIAGNAEFRQLLQDRYRYIQLDEFQDTNSAQMRIVELMIDGIESPNVMAVGDDDQAIMRFQGASVAGIVQFGERTHPENVVLTINYRSTPALVALGQEIAVQIEQRLPASASDKAIVAFREDDEQTTFTASIFESPDIECYELARDLRRRIDEGFIEQSDNPDEAIAVIAAKRQSLRRLIPQLNHFDVPFSYDVQTNVFSMESMQTLLALLRCVAALSRGSVPRAEAELPQIIAAPELGLSPSTILSFAIGARRAHGGHWLRAMEESDDGRIRQLHEQLCAWAACAPTSPLRELIFRIAETLIDYHRRRAATDPLAFAEFNSGIRALLSFAEDEIAAAGRTGRALRLPDFVELVDTASQYGVSIDGSVSLGRPGAVQLKTAHGSKGLEYDLVYLLDSDDATWRRGHASISLCPQNLYLTNVKDEDDYRRLLFVAVTRAKRALEIYSARPTLVKELVGLIETEERDVDANELADVIEVDWQQSYALETPEQQQLIVPDLSRLRLSASALNAFVSYVPGCVNSATFLTRRMLRLPEMPSEPSDFGTVVHAFMQDYVDRVLTGAVDGVELVERYRQRIAMLDFDADAVEDLGRRFGLIVERFLPELAALGRRDCATEVELDVVIDDDIPLTGKCDLLVVDDAARTIRVVDYKTGFRYPGAKPTPNYERQLQFYKLLIESSPEYGDYRVVEGVDVYVEPEPGPDAALHPPVETVIEEGELDHLRALIRAVWHRIQALAFDTEAFESSAAHDEAIAAIREVSPRTKRYENHPLMQRAYEDWLIAEDAAGRV